MRNYNPHPSSEYADWIGDDNSFAESSRSRYIEKHPYWPLDVQSLEDNNIETEKVEDIQVRVMQ